MTILNISNAFLDLCISYLTFGTYNSTFAQSSSILGTHDWILTHTHHILCHSLFDYLRAAITLQWLAELVLILLNTKVWFEIIYFFPHAVFHCCIGEYCEDLKTARECGFFFAIKPPSRLWQYNIDNSHYTFLFLIEFLLVISWKIPGLCYCSWFPTHHYSFLLFCAFWWDAEKKMFLNKKYP